MVLRGGRGASEPCFAVWSAVCPGWRVHHHHATEAGLLSLLESDAGALVGASPMSATWSCDFQVGKQLKTQCGGLTCPKWLPCKVTAACRPLEGPALRYVLPGVSLDSWVEMKFLTIWQGGYTEDSGFFGLGFQIGAPKPPELVSYRPLFISEY